MAHADDVLILTLTGLGAALRCRDKRLGVDSTTILLVALAPWSFFAIPLLDDYILYMGLPQWLPFRLGGDLPLSCAENLLIGGPNCLPCHIESIQAWWLKATSGDGSYHLNELKGDWIQVAFLLIMSMAVSMLFLYHWHRIETQELRERGMARSDIDEEKAEKAWEKGEKAREVERVEESSALCAKCKAKVM